jgi:branched-chain amino acid transport system ATP-binding protein
MSAILQVDNLSGGYGRTQVISDVCLTIQAGEIVGLIGHNGAGKTTTLKTVFGLLKPHRGQIWYAGQDIANTPPELNVGRGVSLVPQEQSIFANLTVQENLDLSVYHMRDRRAARPRIESVYELFPVLAGRLRQQAGTLSGGQRRMLSLGMALLNQPRLLMLDEPSSGLAPALVTSLMSTIERINRDLGTAVLLVEQNVKQTFKISSRVYVMKTGRIVLEETGQTLLERGGWWDLF